MVDKKSMKNDELVARPAYFGRLGLDLLFFLALFLGFTGIVFLRAQALGDGAAAEAITRQITIAAVGAISAWGLACLWRIGSLVRRHKLRVRGNGELILDAVRTKEMMAALEPAGDLGVVFEPNPPIGLNLTVDKNGIELWGGWADVRKMLTITWNDLEPVTLTEVAELGRRSRAINLTVRTGHSTASIPVVITGHGFAGLFGPSRADLLRTIDLIEARRPKL